MAKITDLDPANPLTGDEHVPLVQNGVTRRGFIGSHIASLAMPYIAQAEEARDITIASAAIFYTTKELGEASSGDGMVFAVAPGDGIATYWKKGAPSQELFQMATKALVDSKVSIFNTLADFKANPPQGKATLMTAAGAVDYSWISDDFSDITPDDVIYIKSDHAALTAGVWKKNSGDLISLYQGGTVQDVVNWVSAESFGAVGNGTGSDVSAIQAAIDAASSLSIAGTTSRSSVRLRPGRQYVIDGPIRLKRISLDVRGVGFLVTEAGGFLVGRDCGFQSDGNTQIICDNSYSGTVFKKDPAEASVVTLNMPNRVSIVRLSPLDRAQGVGVDFTGFHTSVINVQVNNMLDAVYCHPLASTDQTYYNRIDVRAVQCGDPVHMQTSSYQLCNGNTFWLSSTQTDTVLRLKADGPASGASSNTFILSYGEQYTEAGVIMDGAVGFNTVIGGVLETGPYTVPCIRMLNGAVSNKIITGVAPSGEAYALEAIGCGPNDYMLGRYGNYMQWSHDIGLAQTYQTKQNGGHYVGNNNGNLAVEHDAASSEVIDTPQGDGFVKLNGAGNITHMGITGLSGSVEVTLMGSGNASLINQAGGGGQFRLKDNANITIPAGKTITLTRNPLFSEANWIEKCRGF
ncbi:hypothetical protein [Parasphingorhabdus sp.]|uniref:hypothetical protein n=1 Tax=Parasphingorhabdus sp. TaxID=2709688 RepID=UPI002F9414E2